MKMEKIEPDTEIAVPSDVQLQLPPEPVNDDSTGPISVIIGFFFLVAAVPYWALRIVSELIWRDVRRVGRVLGVCGSTYREALRRTP